MELLEKKIVELEKIKEIQKRKSINKLRQDINESYFKAGEKVKSQSMKTLLVKVLEELTQNISTEAKVLTQKNKENLLILIDDAHDVRLKYLNWCYEKFKNDPLFFIENGSKPTYIQKRNIKPELYKVENNEEVKTGFNCPVCENSLYVHVYNENKYTACCKNPEHQVKGIDLKFNKETKDFEIGKFASKDLYGTLYTNLVKGQKNKNYGASTFSVSIAFNVSKEVCSFLDKFYSIKKEHIKTDNENKKLINKIMELCSAENIEFKFALKASFNKKEEIESYNTVISQINMWVNENIYQKELAARSDIHLLKRLKGFPSFPLVEKYNQEDEDRKYTVELKKLLEEYKNNSHNYWKNLSFEEFNCLIENYRPYKEAKGKQKTAIEKVYYLFKHFSLKYDLENNKNIEQVYKSVIDYIDRKIEKIEKHSLENSKEDTRSTKAHTEWLIAKSRVFLEYLRNTDSIKFYEEREKFNKLSSLNKGCIFKKLLENKTFEIAGFSKAYKSALIKDEITDKTYQYSLVINPYDEGAFKVDKDKFNCCGFVKEGITSLLPLRLDKEKAITLPLAFGTRQGREYLWNNKYSLEKGEWDLNNARIIQRDEYDKKTKQNKKVHYVAITFTKNISNDFKLFNQDYKAIIGVDRGEKIPVVATIIDLNGNKIETRMIGENYNKTQKEIQSKKEKQLSETGKYSEDLSHKAKNLADNLVKNIAVELLEMAVKHRAIIVFENLSRSFGRGGKRTFMSDKQYTKIEDYLTQKLIFEGLFKGNLVQNTRNGILAKVNPSYTSKTCSNCGTVFTSEDSKYYLNNLTQLDENSFQTLLKNGIPVFLDINYQYWSKKNYEYVKVNANEEIKKILLGKNISDISNTTKEKLQKVLNKALNPRKTQAEFECNICGQKANADEQASLNIARAWIFIKEEEIKVLIQGNFDKTKKYAGSAEKKKYDKSKQEKSGEREAYAKAFENYYIRMIKDKYWKTQN
jgi:transposase